MTDLRRLLGRLRRGKRPALSVAEVELLLGWLTGSASRDVVDAADLPRPEHEPVLLQMVLHCLDDVLFHGGELRLAAAGLDTSEPVKRRRIRFRRLASAFHPDRFPELADWLTQRSQSVHRAYTRFKQDPEAQAGVPDRDRRHPPRHHPGPLRRDMQRAAPRVHKHRIRAFANRLRARFGNDRYLGHKLIGGLTVLALLPVLNMMLVPGSGTEEALYGSRLMVGAGEAEEPVSGFRFPVSGEEHERDSGQMAIESGAGRDRLAQEAPPTARPPGDPYTGRAADQSIGERDSGLGAASSGDELGPDTPVIAAPTESTETGWPAREPETGTRKAAQAMTDREISPLLAAARRAMNPGGETATAELQTIDEQLAAMGLENDTRRLYRRIGEAGEKPVSGLRVPVSGEEKTAGTPAIGRDSAGAASGRDASAQDASAMAEARVAAASGEQKPSLARQAPAPVDDPVPAAPARAKTEPANRQTSELAKPQTSQPAMDLDAGSSGDNPGLDSQSLAGHAPAPVEDSALVLGPLGRHPAGELLQRFHSALAAGDIAGVAGSFTPDARMGSLRGRDQIAEHFRAVLQATPSRNVNLKVLRLGRADDGWLIKANLDIRVDQNGPTEYLIQGRNSFWLTELGDRLMITRMERE